MTSDAISSADPDRNPVDVLADEFAARCRKGEMPSISEYAQRYPDYAEQIRALFPSVVLLEQLGSRPDGAESGARPKAQGSLPPHHRIGDFEIVREIGRGGMGVVYEAVQQSLHRRVALKVLNTVCVHSDNQARRFEREARAAAQLHHTNIVPVFGVGEQDGLRYYVMQRIDGLGLDEVILELARYARAPQPQAPSLGAGENRTVSAWELAGVLISGELSHSRSEAISTGHNDELTSSTVMGPHEASRSGPPLARTRVHRADGSLQNTDDVSKDSETSEQGGPRLVSSSLVLRDDPQSAAGIRSSLILRDEFSSGADREFDPVPQSLTSVAADGGQEGKTHSFGWRYWRNVARIGIQVASGLQYAHSQGTLHRDIKPANILLDTDGTAWIADFGLAKLLEADDVTRTGDVVGTLRYMAPEQFRGHVHQRSDIYSLGLTLYELLALRPAYDETDRQKLIARKLTPHDPPSLRKAGHAVPRDLETIVLKCLAYEPENRYASAGAVIADLQAFLEDRPIQARQASPVERLWRWCRRNPTVAALSGTVALLLLLTAGLTTAGYLQQKQRAAQEEQRASAERALRKRAEESEENAIAERQKAERIAHVAFQWFDNLGQSFVSNDVIGTIELEDEESEEQLQVPAYSPETAAMMEKLRSAFDDLAKIAGEDRRFLDYAAKADLRAGELHLLLDQQEQAKSAFERAIGLYEQFGEEPHDPEARLRLAKLYNGLGVALGRPWNWENREEKRAAQEKALSLLSGDTSQPEVQFELARTHYLMGYWGYPIPTFRRGPGSGSSRSGEDRSDSPREDRPSAVASEEVEPVESAAEEGSRAREEAGRSRRRGGRRFPRNPIDFEKLAQENRKHLEQSTLLFADLVEKYPSVSHYRYWLAMCYLETARQFPRSSDTEEGRDQAIAILTELVEEHPDQPDYLFQLSEAYALSHRQAFPWWGFGPRGSENNPPPEQLAQIEGDLREALRVSDRLIKQQPHVPAYAMSHWFLLGRLVGVLHSQQNFPAALEHLDRLHEAGKTFQFRFPEMGRFSRRADSEPDPLRDYFRAQILVSEGKLDEARVVLQSLVNRYEESEPREQGWRGRFWSRYWEMAEVYRLLENCLQRLGRPEAAAAVRAKLETLEDRRRNDGPRERGNAPQPPVDDA